MDRTILFACIAALVAAAGWGLGTILFERVLRSAANPPTAAACNLFKNVLAGSLFAAVAWILGHEFVPREAWGVLLISGALGFAVGDTCTFLALPRCGVQLTALLSNLIPPLAALLAWIFLDESLSLMTLLWMGVVILGVVIVITESSPEPEAKTHRGQGIFFGALASLAQAVAIVVGRHGFQGVEIFPGTVTRILGGVGGALILTVLVSLFRRQSPARELDILTRPLRRPKLATGLIVPTFFAAVLILPLHSFALRGAPGGVAAALLATTPLFTLPLGLLFGTRPTLRTSLGTAIGFVGAVGTIVSTS